MTADELARFLHDETNRWMMRQRRDPFAAWDRLKPWHRDLYLAVAEAVLRELGRPAPLVVDAWTRTPPQADGYYWFRWNHDSAPAVVKVHAGQGRIVSEWRPLAVLRGEWCGPLVPPGKSESP